MMNKKAMSKMMTILIVVIVLVAAVASTYVATTLMAPSKKQAKLQLMTEYTSGSLKEAIEMVCSKFNQQNPDVLVVHQPIDHATLNNIMPIWLGTSSAPDLHQWFGGARSKELVDLGYCVDWTTEFNKIKDEFPLGVQNGHMLVNGKAYSVPIAVHTYGLFYMKGILAQYNIQPPSTWAQLVAACVKIETESGGAISPWVVPAKFPWTPDLQFTSILSQSVSSDFFNGLLDGTQSWQDDKVLYALQRYAEVVPYLVSDYKELDEFGATQALAAGRTALDISGPWRNSMLKDAGKTPITDYDWVPVPEILAQYKTQMPTHSDVIVANTHTLYPEECKRFLAYCASKEAQEIFAQKGGNIAGNSEINLGVYDAVQTKIYNYMQTTTDVVVEVSLAVRQEVTNPWFDLMAEFCAHPERYEDIARRLDQIAWAPT